MLLTITTTHQPATDLGYLLANHPDKCQSFNLSFGQAHVFYPEATAERCTAAMLLDVDFYESPWGTRHPKLQILTVAELLAGKGIDMPPTRDVRTFKKAPRAKAKTEDAQRKLIEE